MNAAGPTDRSAAPRFSNRLWGVAALLVGFAGLGNSGRLVVLASSQNDWVPVEATVVQAHTTQRTKGSAFSTHTSSHFAYRYVVEGQSYTAGRYSFWSVGGDRSRGTAHFEPGDHLTAFHHPRRPEIAVVERVRPSVFVWMVAVFAAVFAVRGAMMITTGKAAG